MGLINIFGMVAGRLLTGPDPYKLVVCPRILDRGPEHSPIKNNALSFPDSVLYWY
jgi:hypothetical protein